MGLLHQASSRLQEQLVNRFIVRIAEVLKMKFHVQCPWSHVCCYMATVCLWNCKPQMVIISGIHLNWNLILLLNLGDLANHID